VPHVHEAERPAIRVQRGLDGCRSLLSGVHQGRPDVVTELAHGDDRSRIGTSFVSTSVEHIVDPGYSEREYHVMDQDPLIADHESPLPNRPGDALSNDEHEQGLHKILPPPSILELFR
jgi:hypothetical protein